MQPGQHFCGLTAEHLEHASAICRWPQAPGRPISYGFLAFLPDLGEAVQRSLTQAGFAMIERVCGARFLETEPARANIVISVGRGRRSNFDGDGGVLAWAELPCGGNPTQCRLMFDGDEPWIGQGQFSGGIKYLLVMVHEACHASGLPHAPAGSQNIMAPIYNPRLVAFGPWDVEQLVARYGDPKPAEPPAPPADGAFDPKLAVFEYGGKKFRLEAA